jgi:hypothetical protein
VILFLVNCEFISETVLAFLSQVNATSGAAVEKLSFGSDFEMAYHLDCVGLLSDFHEDIEFRFSLGITSLARRFLGPRGWRRMAGYSEVLCVYMRDYQ